MENEKETKIQPGMRFYFKHLDWAKEQGGEIFAPLMTVLFGLAMDHKNDTGEIIWINEGADKKGSK